MAMAATRRFDPDMFRAALAYYNLLPDYNRVFTPMYKGVIQEKVVCNPRVACEDGRPVWVQVNLPWTGYPLRPALSQDIAVYHNLVLDFECPEDPPRALEVGLLLAARLADLDLATPHPEWLARGRPSVPVECTGAGVHICLPIAPLQTREWGGPETVDEAVRRVVDAYIKPAAVRLLGDDAENLLLCVHAYDIGHVYSFPGTWRPANFKDRDCETLWPGFLRHWYRHAGDEYPVPYPIRRESQVLGELIRAECRALGAADLGKVRWPAGLFAMTGAPTAPRRQENAATLPASIAAPPEGITPSPEGITPSPEGITPSPEGITPSPEGIASLQESIAALPDSPIALPADQGPDDPHGAVTRARYLESPYDVVDTSTPLPAPASALRDQDYRFLERARALAEHARSAGERADGAVVVDPGGQVIGEGYERVQSDHDAGAHAAAVAIRQAGRVIGVPRLAGCTLYTNREPCLMCVLLLTEARISRLVYGAPSTSKPGPAGAAFLGLSAHDAAAWMNLQAGWPSLEVVGGVLAEAGSGPGCRPSRGSSSP